MPVSDDSDQLRDWQLSRLLRAAAFIERELTAPIDLAAIADAACVAPRTLQRLFTDHVGEGVMAFVRGRRLTSAAQLLKQPGASVTRIALDHQFDSVEGFSRAFSRQYWSSPRQFRHHPQQQHAQSRPQLDEHKLRLLARLQQQPVAVVHWPAARWLGLEVRVSNGGFPCADNRLRIMAGWAEQHHQPVTQLIFRRAGDGADARVLTSLYQLPPAAAPGQQLSGGLSVIDSPAGHYALFNYQDRGERLPTFLYHCYGQWLAASGWCLGDAPLRLITAEHEHEQPRQQLAVPLSPQPDPCRRFWNPS